MIKVGKFATVHLDSVVYLSFNIDPKFDLKNKRLLIYFRPYQTYTIANTQALLLRKVVTAGPKLEYMRVRSTKLEFIPAPDDRLYLLRHYD